MKIGVIGCGKIGNRHLRGYRQLPVEVVVADTLPGLAATIAGQNGVQFREHPMDLLADPTIDAVDVCVPTNLHRDLVIEAVSAGKHVFCEKPLCPSVTDALAVREAAAATEKVVMVGFLQRFHPAFEYVHSVLGEGAIGRLRFASFRVGGRGSHAAWKHRAVDGGGVVLEMLIHKLDQIRWFFGRPDDIEVLVWDTLRTERIINGAEVAADAEDLVVLQLRVGDLRIICQGDFLTLSYMDHVEVQGDNGSIFTSLLEYLPTVVYCKDPQGGFEAGTHTRHFSQVNLFERELRHFLDAMETGKPDYMNSVNESIITLELVEEIRKQTSERQFAT